MPQSISIIVPALNEAAGIAAVLRRLQPLRQRGVEVLVVDGGSEDETCALAAPLADQVLCSARGRAVQMNAGAARAQGEILLFLHADSQLPDGADDAIRSALAPGVGYKAPMWGRFDVAISGSHALLRVVAWCMNLRSRLTHVATGDQGLFVRADTFLSVGGFPPIPLMEDIALCKRLRRLGAPANLRARITTSGRRWEKKGVWKTICLMWSMRLAYFLGVSPSRLQRVYAR